MYREIWSDIKVFMEINRERETLVWKDLHSSSLWTEVTGPVRMWAEEDGEKGQRSVQGCTLLLPIVKDVLVQWCTLLPPIVKDVLVHV